MTKQQIGAVIILSTLLALMLSCGAALCRATEPQERPTPLGVVIDHSNPNVSLVGSVVAGSMVQDAGRKATVLRIHPRYTYALFDETITFCGDESNQVTELDGRLISGWVAFTYKRAASRLINGVPCFTLRSVDRVGDAVQRP